MPRGYELFEFCVSLLTIITMDIIKKYLIVVHKSSLSTLIKMLVIILSSWIEHLNSGLA